MSNENFKHQLYEQFARIGKSLSSGPRLELLEYLAQGERNVESLSKLSGLAVANTSQHLRQLHQAGLVVTRKSAQQVFYRLADEMVIDLLATLRKVAERNLAEIERLVNTFLTIKDELEPITATELLRRVKKKEVTVLDVRPFEEYKEGHLPIRPTHNDTKVNNVLMDSITGEGVCVIDLDTAMSGVSIYDFGDLVRTALSTKEEDQRDLSGVCVELPRFEVILKGFLKGCGDNLNRHEIHHLLTGAKFMTLLIGMRFLTDYLQGDPYFKIQREGQNLDRCRRQFKLGQSIMDHEDEMQEIINKELKRYHNNDL